MARFNPFRPGTLVGPGMISGRVQEIITLEKVLFQTRNRNSHHFLIHGERGIGKSSLMFYMEIVARGEITASDDTCFSFLTTCIELDPSNSYVDIIKKVGSEFHRTISNYDSARTALK